MLLSSTVASAATVEGTTVEFRWEPAAGPVMQYGVWITRNGVESDGPLQYVPSPSVSIGGSPGDQLSVRTAAFDANGVQGPFSASSELVLFVVSESPPPPIPPPDEPPPPDDGEPAPSPEEPPARRLAYDFDADGQQDLLWFDGLRHAQMAWLMQAGGPHRILASTRRTLPEVWAHTSTADFDGDGGSDLLWSNASDGAAFVQPMPGGVAGRGVVLAFPGPGWAALALGNEPAPDDRARVLWIHAVRGEARLWRGGSVQDPAAEETLLVTTPGLEPSCACDLDGDGLRDAVLTGEGRVEVLRPGSGPTWAVALEEGESVRSCADLDGDGRASVLLQLGRHGDLRVVEWASDGQPFEERIPLPVPRELVMGGDFDGDGRAELALRRFDRVFLGSVADVAATGGTPLEERVSRQHQALTTAW